MKTLPISKRLMAVASLIPECCIVADIGTVHGYVPAYLALSGQCKYVIASDIAEGPCFAAAETRIRYGIQDVMDIRRAPGLQGLSAGEAETVVIAGMGGATILSIMQEDPGLTESVTTFVLQPMNAAGLLRQWLTEHGFALLMRSCAKIMDIFMSFCR